MVSKGDDLVVLWPRYFDRKVSRKAGRRVPENLAVAGPDAAWVLAACKKAGLKAELQPKARYPALPWKIMGRVIVTGAGGKEATIQKVAAAMQK